MTALDTTVVATAPALSRPRFSGALVRACRPEQWVKNALVLTAPLAAGAIFDSHIALRAALVFVAFSCAASAGYLVNDLLDVETDRSHPRKRFRPIAAGEVSQRTAWFMAIALAFGALGLAAASGRQMLTVVVGIYLLVTITYSAGIKGLPYVEVTVVSFGFLLRAVGGAIGTGVPPSEWFLAVCTFGALTVALGKRLAEFIRVAATNETGRSVLHAYQRDWLAGLRTASAAAMVLAYVGWALSSPMHDSRALALLSALPLTAALVVYLIRNDSGGGEAPEQLFMHDRLLGACGAVWLGFFIAAVQL